MATYAGKVRSTAVDNATIRLNASGEISAGGIMEPFSAGTKGGAPSVFYVDGNVVSSGNGLGWLSAFKTLTEGLVAAQTYQATAGNRSWAHRPTVYVCGDDLAETIVAWAQKSDVIGVGSDDGNKGPRILGHHVVTAYNVSTANYIGCRLFNITFKPTTTTVIFDVPTGQGGFEWHNCKWEWDAFSTTALKMTALGDCWVNNCRFVKGSGTGFTTAAILFGDGITTNNRITNCYIDASIGIVVPSGVTMSEGNLIEGNTIIAETFTINDSDSTFYVINNRCISDAAQGSGTSYNYNVTKAAGNIDTGSGDTKEVPISS